MFDLKAALLGDLPAFSSDPLGFIEKACIGPSAPVPLRFGPRAALLLADPASIRRVLVDARDKYGKGPEQARLRPLFGDGMITSSGRRWEQSRHVARGAFSTSELNAGLRLAFNVLAGEVGRLAGAIGNEVSLHPMLGRLTMRMVVAALFHARIDDEAAETVYAAGLVAHRRLTASMWRLIDFDLLLPTAERRRYEQAIQNLEAVVAELPIGERSALAGFRELVGEHGPDVIRDEAITMLIAGFETTADAASWLVYSLACRPDLVTWLRPEVDRAMDGAWGLDPQQLRDMPRTRAFVQEILRLYPSTWWFARAALERDELCGVPVSKGTAILICPWALHRQPYLWPDPEALDPRRFLDGAPSDKFAYVPFGFGPRTCVGAQLATAELMGIAAMSVSAFDLEPASGPLEQLRPVGGVTLAPPPAGLHVRFGLRRSNREAA